MPRRGLQAFALVRFPLCAAALLALGSCREGVNPGEDDEMLQSLASGTTCGVERWAVKTGTDAAAASVNLTPQNTTIAALRGLPIPAGLGSSSPRFAGTAEMQAFRLTDVTLTQYKLESDSDYHLVLQDAAGATLIVEVPIPACVSGGTWGPAITASRNAVDARLSVTGSFQTANLPVTITGVGFFDLLHGQTGVAPNGIELHAVLSICFGLGCGGAASPDFSLSASPASVSSAQGAATSATVTQTAANGFTGSVGFSAGGLPSGATAGFSPTSVTGSGTSTLTLTAGAATAAGTYPIAVTGTSGTLSHTTSVSWTVTAAGGGALVNGGFETGTLSGWSSTGSTSIITGSHSGTSAAQIGATSPTTDSSLSQTVTLPAGSPRLSFFYKVTCPDTVTYDWATVQVKNAAGTVLATPLAKTCTNGGAWVQSITDLTAFAGQSVTLIFSNHDDNYAGDATYTQLDDVAITVPAPQPVTNGGFEAGTLSGWTPAGVTSVITAGHSGGYAAQLGSSSPSTDSSISQTLTLPAGSPRLTFWYKITCPDTVTYDWATVQVKNAAGTVVLTPLAKTCTNAGAWVQGSLDLTAYASQSVTLVFSNHDDNYAGDATFTAIDDVAIN